MRSKGNFYIQTVDQKPTYLSWVRRWSSTDMRFSTSVWSMGNLNNQTWDELWNSSEAEKVRAKVRCCDRDCWMIGSVSPAMHKYIWKPATWVLVHKFKALFTKHPYSMYELKICRDYRDGKVSKEDLDKCSTCDMNCVINVKQIVKRLLEPIQCIRYRITNHGKNLYIGKACKIVNAKAINFGNDISIMPYTRSY